MSPSSRLNLYRRLTNIVPTLVAVIINVLVLSVAFYFVTETIIDKKKTFEEAPPMDSSFKKQVEHRLQVARKAGGTAHSPISAHRIMSSESDALKLPDMPQLPQVGASSISTAGFDAGMGVSPAPFNTGIGGAGGSGTGSMTISFLGVTNQRISKVVFVVDVSLDIMDISKGGFLAYSIIRDEIMRLVSALSPSAEFNVVLFEGDSVRLFADELMPGTFVNKTKFFAWMKPINSSLSALGISSAKGSVTCHPVVPPNVGIDPYYHPSIWINSVHAALQLKPDDIFLITGSAGNGVKEISPAEFERCKLAAENQNKEIEEALKQQHLDPAAVDKARNSAMDKALADFNEINEKLEAAGKPPFIIVSSERLADADFQAAVHKAGYKLKIDYTGWSTKDGKPIWCTKVSAGNLNSASLQDAHKFISRLQAAFVRQTATLNIFYFVGPSYKPDSFCEDFAKTARRYNGKFEILTTERLQQLQSEADKNISK